MTIRYFDVAKAIEAIVYISRSTTDLFHIMKILYYADLYHLQAYGRLITGDYYIAMNNGPVPSGSYDLIKVVRGDGFAIKDASPEKAFAVEGRMKVTPLRAPDMSIFSESDVECLDKSIAAHAHMSFAELRRKAHEEKPFQQATPDDDISFESIVGSLPNAAEVLEYLNG